MKLGRRWLKKVAPSDRPEVWVPVIVEIARGSRMKYALDMATGQLTMHRALPRDLGYPTSYGFVAHTTGDDGMEIDMLILAAEPLLPLTIVKVRTIGGCTVEDSGKGREDKLVGVALGDPSVADLDDIADLPVELARRIEEFFTTYKRDEGVTVEFRGWMNRADALRRLASALEAKAKAKRKK